MSCGVIAGPKGPKDEHSYLVPFDEKLARLARGVPTFDSLTGEVFDLHAYNLFGHGDIIAIEKMMNIKGHNSRSPCRSCEMKGVLGPKTVYYIPLAAPCDELEAPDSWDPRDLPLRTHQHFLDKIEEIQKAPTKTHAKELVKFHGIKGLPVLHRVSSMDIARSYPWDFMHLLFENIIPNLIALWSGKFKGLEISIPDPKTTRFPTRRGRRFGRRQRKL